MKFLLSFLLLLVCTSAFSEIAESISDPTKKYRVVAPEQSIEFSLKTLQNTSEENYDVSSAQEHFNLGQAYYTLSEYKKSLSHFKSAIQIYKKINFKESLSDSYYYIALTYWALDLHDSVTENLIRSLDIELEINNPAGLCDRYIQTGDYYYYISLYNTALPYYIKAAKLAVEESIKEADVYSKLGKLYYKQNNKENSANYFGRAKQIYIDQKNDRKLATLYFDLGCLLRDFGDSEGAIDRFSHAAKLLSNSGDIFSKASINLELAKLLSGQHKYSEMLRNIKLAEEYADALLDTVMMQKYLMLYSEYYENIGNYRRALEFYKQSNVLQTGNIVSESLDKKGSSGKMNILQKDNLQKEFEILEQQLMILIVVFLAVIFILVLYYKIRTKKRTNILLQQNKKVLEDEVYKRTLELSKSNLKLKEEMLEREELSKQLLRSQYFASIGELAGVVAHEIRNPLAAISSTAQYCRKKLKDQEFIELMDVISDSSNKANKTIKSLLKFSKPKNVKLAIGDIADIINKVSKLTEAKFAEHNIQFIKFIPASTAQIMMDTAGMESVFMNLFLNAAEAMSSGGKAELNVKTLENIIEIQFSDTGSGISEEDLGKIFAPFFTTKKAGNGIGLSIVQQIINYHNGNITVKSEVDKGTEFKITLPKGNTE